MSQDSAPTAAAPSEPAVESVFTAVADAAIAATGSAAVGENDEVAEANSGADAYGLGEAAAEGDDDRPDTPEEFRKAPADRLIIPADVTSFDVEDESIYVVGTRDGKVTRIQGLEHMKNLKELILRSCLVNSMDGIETLTGLRKLELYDNHVQRIAHISNMASSLVILDISFNSIRDMAPVASCPLLEELYIAQNKLRRIDGLQGLDRLRVLDLGANRIRDMTGLQHLGASMQSLWLGKNKITEVSHIQQMVNLRQLDVQSNRLTTLGDGIRTLHNLEELYLAHDKIESIEGCLPEVTDEHSPKLNTIDLTANGLKSLVGFEQQVEIEELWIGSSGVASFEDVTPLQALPKLNCLYLEHSPISADFEYRLRISKLLPALEQLDAVSMTRLTIAPPPGVSSKTKFGAALLAQAQARAAGAGAGAAAGALEGGGGSSSSSSSS